MHTPLIVSVGITPTLTRQLEQALPGCTFIHHSCEDAALDDIIARPPRVVLFSPPPAGNAESRYAFLLRLTRLQQSLRPPVIVLSGHCALLEDKEAAFSAGAYDYLAQPVTNSELAIRMAATLGQCRTEEALLHLSAHMSSSRNIFLKGMATLTAMKDPDTGGHLLRVARYIKVLLEAPAIQRHAPGLLTGQDIKEMSKAAILHDIGKVHIPDAILQKPGPLTAEEFNTVKTHTLHGGNLLHSLRLISDSRFLEFAEQIARTHHERWDGSGYPLRLQGDEIPYVGRLMAVADVYDATRFARVYKGAWPHSLSTQYIMDNRGVLFDPVVAECFYENREIFKNISTSFQKIGSAFFPESGAVHGP